MRTTHHQDGLTSTELAVVMPIVIVLILVPFQVALWWNSHHVAEAAAREALDTAQVDHATPTDGEAAAYRFLNAAGNLTNPSVTVTRTARTVTVTVTGESPRLIPGVTWTVAASATGPIEQFLTEDQP